MKPEVALESILFASGEPLRKSELARLLGVDKRRLESLLEALQQGYRNRGIRLVTDQRSARLVTAPEAGSLLAEWRQSELRGKLSNSALETLAVIAYRGPITRPEIERVRGVQSVAPLRTLLVRGLVEEVGRASEPGRPYRYVPTLELYQHLGVSGPDELPEMPERLVSKLHAATHHS